MSPGITNRNIMQLFTCTKFRNLPINMQIKLQEILWVFNTDIVQVWFYFQKLNIPREDNFCFIYNFNEVSRAKYKHM